MDPDANYRAEAQNKFEIQLDWINLGLILNGESTVVVMLKSHTLQSHMQFGGLI